MNETTPTNTTFRTATESSPVSAPAENTVSKSSQTQPASAETADAPPSLYQTLNKQPYVVKHLDLDLYYGDGDFEGVQSDAKELDKYVLQQIKGQGLKDTKDSYKEVIDAIYKQIGRSPNEDPIKAVHRLSVAAKAISRLESAKLPSVLSAKNLSPKEYEDVQP